MTGPSREHGHKAPLTLLLAMAMLPTALSQAAPVSPALRCQAAKLRAAGLEARSSVFCEQRDLDSGAKPMCVSDARERRDEAFARAEAGGGCTTNGDSASIGNEVTTFVAAVLAALRPGGPASSRCTTAQLGTVGRAVGQLVQAYERDKRNPNSSKLAADFATAQSQFASSFVRALAKGDCLSTSSLVDAYALVSGAVDRLLGELFPACGDGVVAPSEQCDGSTCPDSGPPGDYGCFPPSSSNACECCAQAGPCYIRGFGNVTPIEIPCCSGTCPIPGPEAGPNVMVSCTPPPTSPCPCWTSESLAETFPPGIFGENGRGGATCESDATIVAVSSVDTCFILQPGGPGFTLPRLGAGVVADLCVLFSPDLDQSNSGVCNRAPTLSNVTPEAAAGCIAALLESGVAQRECN